MQEFLAAHAQIAALLRTLLQSSEILIVVTVIFAPLEAFFSLRKAPLFYPGWGVDLGWYFVNALVLAFVLAAPLNFVARTLYAVLPHAMTNLGTHLPPPLRMIAAMIVGEAGFYWGHRWSHEIPFLWRFHAVHHSARHIGYLVNTRAHPIDLVFTRLCGVSLMVATGLAGAASGPQGLGVALILFVGSIWSYFIHANIRLRLGFFEEILASPFFHHWHHTREDHKDHNYASMLPVMDRIFGTHYAPKAWPAEYGISEPTPDNIPAQFLGVGRFDIPFSARGRRSKGNETPRAGVGEEPDDAERLSYADETFDARPGRSS